MTRPLRIQYEGAMYHIMNRGACRAPVFNSNKHRELFLNLLEEIVQIFKIEIHAYCLMDNHYHLLIQTPLANISKAMRHLNSVYTIKYNKMEKKDGALYRGRYKSKLVENDAYGIHLVRYIHLNPFIAGMVGKIQDYKWSSFRAYLGIDIKPGWLSFSYTLSNFDKENFCSEFLDFTSAGNPDFIDKLFSDGRSQPIIGSEEFIKKIKSEYAYISVSNEVSERHILRPTLDRILGEVSSIFDIDIASIKISKRGITNNARTMVMLIACKHYGYKLVEISKFFGISSYKTTSKLTLALLKEIERDNRLRLFMTEILDNLNIDVQ